MEEELGIIKQGKPNSPISDIEAKQNSKDLEERKRIRGKYQEPATHQNNKSLWEQLFGSCFGQQLDLTSNEIEAFGNLREDSGEKFDQNNPSHLMALGELWNLLTGTIMDKDNFFNEKWVSFGFQNKNPSTDFRGGGFQSLLQMIKFAKQNNQLVLTQMCAPENDFFFALSSINVTFYLKQTLHLAIHLNQNQGNNIICNRQSFKMFCSLLTKDENLFDQFHDLVLKDLYYLWIAFRSEYPSATILNFNEVQDKYKKKFKEVLERSMYASFQEFQESYQH